jgi:nicotinamide phosphoribosyltransferase
VILRPLLPSPTLNPDGYKLGHADQSPPGTGRINYNITARSAHYAKKFGRVLPDYDDKVVAAGMKHVADWYLRDYWHQEFFSKSLQEAIDEFREIVEPYMAPAIVDMARFVNLHKLGYLPIEFKAIPDGIRVPIGVPLATWEATIPEFGWLAGYLETPISSEIWGPTTTATIGFEFKRMLHHFACITGSDLNFVTLQGHDFSARGKGGILDAAHSQIGHLYNFRGTDTMSAIQHIFRYQNTQGEWLATSVRATEHSMTSLNIQWEYQALADSGLSHEERLLEAEVNFVRRLLTEVYPTGIFSYVSDTYDYFTFISKILPRLKDVIEAREAQGPVPAKFVVRPDSGSPIKIICGDPDAEPGSPEHKGSLQVLWEVFGGTTKNGFKFLNPYIGLIYGDGITVERGHEILKKMYLQGWASQNIVFGIGSFSYQYNTRDSFGIAVKATWGEVLTQALNIYKDPKTDDGTKKSAVGLLKVINDNGRYTLLQNQDRTAVGYLNDEFTTEEAVQSNELKTMFFGTPNGPVSDPNVKADIRTIRARLDHELYWAGEVIPTAEPVLL